MSESRPRSIRLPDELWERLQALSTGGHSPSSLIRSALESFLNAEEKDGRVLTALKAKPQNSPDAVQKLTKDMKTLLDEDLEPLPSQAKLVIPEALTGRAGVSEEELGLPPGALAEAESRIGGPMVSKPRRKLTKEELEAIMNKDAPAPPAIAKRHWAS